MVCILCCSIPLIVRARAARWPVNAANPDSLREPLETRLRAVLDQLVADNADGALPWIVRMFALPGVVDFVAKGVIENWKQELKGAGLIT
jgi:hypothetical protein